MDALISQAAAARLLNVSRQAIAARQRRGSLPRVVVGTRTDGRARQAYVPIAAVLFALARREERERR